MNDVLTNTVAFNMKGVLTFVADNGSRVRFDDAFIKDVQIETYVDEATFMGKPVDLVVTGNVISFNGQASNLIFNPPSDEEDLTNGQRKEVKDLKEKLERFIDI